MNVEVADNEQRLHERGKTIEDGEEGGRDGRRSRPVDGADDVGHIARRHSYADKLEGCRLCSDVEWLKTGAGERDGRDAAVVRCNGVAGGTRARHIDDVSRDIGESWLTP